MINLVTTSDLIQLITAGTQALKIQASYVDLASGAVTAGRLNTAVSSATTTTIVGSPGSSVSRNVKFISIYNADASASNTITVQHTDGTTVVALYVIALQAGQTLTYNDLLGWSLNTPVHGLFIKTTVILNGTTSLTTTAQTNFIKARLLGAGGAGGGCPATAGNNGGGGSEGAYAEWSVAVSPNTTYTCAIGAGGTGASAAVGGNGGATTLTIGGTTCTAPGGIGGPVGVATNPVQGAASPSVATNGTFNSTGSPGGGSVFGATGRGGDGAASLLGGGGLGKAPPSGTGGAATGFGAGGGGAMCTTAAAQVGGAGSNGVLIIDEYT